MFTIFDWYIIFSLQVLWTHGVSSSTSMSAMLNDYTILREITQVSLAGEECKKPEGKHSIRYQYMTSVERQSLSQTWV